MAAGWQFVTTLPQLAVRLRRRCAGGYVHLRQFGSPDAYLFSTGYCDGHTTTERQAETAQSVAAIDEMSGEEELTDILNHPHSAVQASLTRLHVNLGSCQDGTSHSSFRVGSC